MSSTSHADPKAWLNAKDNWLGEGPFRPAEHDVRRLAHNIGLKEGSITGSAPLQQDISSIDTSDVYFAHG